MNDDAFWREQRRRWALRATGIFHETLEAFRPPSGAATPTTDEPTDGASRSADAATTETRTEEPTMNDVRTINPRQLSTEAVHLARDVSALAERERGWWTELEREAARSAGETIVAGGYRATEHQIATAIVLRGRGAFELVRLHIEAGASRLADDALMVAAQLGAQTVLTVLGAAPSKAN